MEETLTPETVFTLETALVTYFVQHFKIIYMSNNGKILLYLKANCETFRVSANGVRAILLQQINMWCKYQAWHRRKMNPTE
jgi:hypothetical protein